MREAKGKREENKEEGKKWEGEDEGEKIAHSKHSVRGDEQNGHAKYSIC